MVGILMAVGVLGFLILVHEWGHFIVARRMGMRINEFCIFFPPRLVSWERGGIRYSIGGIPLGGFVRIAGLEFEDEQPPDGFYRHSVGRRALVILAGPVMNFLLAFLLIGYLAFAQTDAEVLNVVDRVKPGTAAAKAQPDALRSGDQIFGIEQMELIAEETFIEQVKGRPHLTLSIWRDGVTQVVDAASLRLGDKVGTISGLRKEDRLVLLLVVRGQPGQIVNLVIDRGAAKIHRKVELGINEQQQWNPETKRLDHIRTGQLGISFVTSPLEPVPLMQRLKRVVSAPFIYSKNLLFVLFQLFQKPSELKKTAGGPVRIVYELQDMAWLGWSGRYQLIDVAAQISWMVAFFNLLPVPPLDGGKLALFVWELVVSLAQKLNRRGWSARPIAWLSKSTMSQKLEMRFQLIGLILLLSLFALITYSDVTKLLFKR